MSLAFIDQLDIPNRSSMSTMAWRQAEELRAEKVARFRRYADGDHDNRMTVEQKRLLNIRSTQDDSTEFNDNLCAIILDTPLDRIQLTGVNASTKTVKRKPVAAPNSEPATTDPTQQWVDDLLEDNRIDALQVDVHEAALRDGNTYLMVYPDIENAGMVDERRVVRFSHEPAYDGSYGMIVRYATTNSTEPLFAIKVWQTSSVDVGDTIRVNVFFPDRIARFESVDVAVNGTVMTQLRPYDGDGQEPVISWRMADGSPIGVPIIHFRNRGSSTDNFGLSELENVVPLQDATNVALTSTIATALLSGFPIRGAVGFQAPAAVTPGQVLSVTVKNAAGGLQMDEAAANYLSAVRFEQYDTGDLSQLISLLQYLKGEMFAVTNTPTDDVAADASGEARKQAEVKLIGKVHRFEVRNGNAWEDAVRMAARIQDVFSSEAPPVLDKLAAQWSDAEVRNDSKFVDDMLKQYREGVIDHRTYLEKVADIYDYTPDDIDTIIQRTDAARNARAADAIDEQDVQNAERTLASIGVGQARVNVNGNGNGAAVNGSSPTP